MMIVFVQKKCDINDNHQKQNNDNDNIIRTFKIKWEFFNQKKNDNNQRNKTKIANPSVLILHFMSDIIHR